MTKSQKPTEAEDKSADHLEYFWEMIWKIQEVRKALTTQETVLNNLKDMQKDLPQDSVILYTLDEMMKATSQMYAKMGDVERVTNILCREITEEKNILYSVLLDDLRMYADSGRPL